MSTHSVNIVKIAEVRPHGNAERLEIIPVDGWQAVVKIGEFKVGDLAVYIEPDYIVPTTREEFTFLAKEGRDRHRLKAVRLRGVLSFGLLIPVPTDLMGLSVGTDVMERLGIERYEPPIKLSRADDLPPGEWPRGYASKFDVEALKRYPDIFRSGEPVIVTEKIHGSNARYLFENDTFYIGSRTRWLKPNGSHPWKLAADNDPQIEGWCRTNVGTILYGEIYGPVQSLKYGGGSSVKFAAFAALRKGEWFGPADIHGIQVVPILYQGPYGADIILPLAELDSSVPGAGAGHMREGIVIVPAIERRDEAIGRVALKHISNRYWESAA